MGGDAGIDDRDHHAVAIAVLPGRDRVDAAPVGEVDRAAVRLGVFGGRIALAVARIGFISRLGSTCATEGSARRACIRLSSCSWLSERAGRTRSAPVAMRRTRFSAGGAWRNWAFHWLRTAVVASADFSLAAAAVALARSLLPLR
jgi:hypothetical protein